MPSRSSLMVRVEAVARRTLHTRRKRAGTALIVWETFEESSSGQLPENRQPDNQELFLQNSRGGALNVVVGQLRESR
jgi:hypothetical protein